ncbi:TetR/AcrR family transcriptional regulator C-terminal domain-containing protein [Actinokineospora guangxiensis]|uniref:TetR/AcrR family transcriptional regulator C-terminal domain-containing protein n=1 Tax=Actinokineospora guangxiensis TaxID=1490288 RepID=A0ABW0EUT8_9PSEU
MNSTEPAPRRGRPPKGASRLSRDAIVAATLAVIGGEGVAAVSMRTVAKVLGVDPKSLYNHVDGKEGLLDAVAERILGAIELPAPGGDTRDDLRRIAHAFRASAFAHPEAASLVLTRRLGSTAALAPTDAVLRVLAAAGFPPDRAVHVLRFLLAALTGALLREHQAAPDFGTEATAVDARRAVLDSAALPAVAAAADHLARFDRDAEFAFTVEAAIDAVMVQAGPAG